MQVLTNRLTPIQLDYIIALLEYPHLVWGDTIGLHHASNQLVIPELPEPKCYYSPSYDWHYVGKLIIKEGLNIIRTNTGDKWICEKDTDKSTGSTPLLAVLRLYISSRLGSIVEIPFELVGETK